MKLRIANKGWFIALTLSAVMVTSITTASGSIVFLKDGNSTASVDVDSPAGMFQWTVDGVNHLNQQWFWYRVGSGPQFPINTISAASWTQNALNTLNTTYANTIFSVNINYTLTGGGTGSADIDEGIRIHNFTTAPLTLSFYQYSDFNLLNTPLGDTVWMDASQAFQWKAATQVAEGIIAPNATAFEANSTGGAGSTLFKLGSLNDLVLSGNNSAGPGDVTWAFQWNLTVPAEGDEVITKDKLLNIYVIPEPSAFAFVSLGFGALLLLRRRA
jgi:hypothetical protein